MDDNKRTLRYQDGKVYEVDDNHEAVEAGTMLPSEGGLSSKSIIIFSCLVWAVVIMAVALIFS